MENPESPKVSIKSGASATEESFDLFIGSRSVGEDEDETQVDYLLRDVIGEGGMGKVYLATQSALHRDVAVKFSKDDVSKAKASDSAETKDKRDSFISEVVVTGQLDHPNIVPVYDLSESQTGQPFYSMKLVKGRPWNKCIRAMDEDEQLDVLLKVCDALSFCHHEGRVIHRDIKPHNIMIGEYGEVTLMDFGLAQRLDDDTVKRAGSRSGPCGTLLYLPPEMADPEFAPSDESTDIYLLGAVLYEVITGNPPHPVPDRNLDTAQRRDKAALNAARNVIVPTEKQGELVNIARKAMETFLEARYESVDAFKEAIKTYQSNKGSYKESMKLTTRGEEYLEMATANGESSGDHFDDYNRARFAFADALALWPKNEQASMGQENTIQAYARYALKKKAYDLGLDILDPDNDAHRPLRQKLEAGRNKQDNDEKNRKRLVAGIRILVLAGLTGVAVFAFYVYRQKEKELGLKVTAQIESLEARKSELDTSIQKFLAEQNEEIAENQKKLAEANAKKAREQEDVAKDNAKKARRQERIAEHASYVSEIGVTAEDIQRNAFDVARKNLRNHTPGNSPVKAQARGWEWGYLHNSAHNAPIGFKELGRVESVALSRDQRCIVAGTADGRLYVWRRTADGRSYKLPWSPEPLSRISSVAVSEDGALVAVASDKGAKIWHVAHLEDKVGQTVPLKANTGRPVSVAFSKDATRLVISTEKGWVGLWSRSDGLIWMRKHDDVPIWSARFSPPDGRWVVTGDEKGTVLVWDAEKGQLEERYDGHGEQPVYTAEFAPDGRSIVSGGRDGRLLAWEFPKKNKKGGTYKERRASEVNNRLLSPSDFARDQGLLLGEHTATVRSISFAENGPMLLLFSAGHDNTIRVWDVSTDLRSASLKKVLRGHGRWVRSCMATADGSHVLSGSYDGSVNLWNRNHQETPQILREKPTGRTTDLRLKYATYSPAGDWVATAADNGIITVWDMRAQPGPQPQHPYEGHDWLTTTGIFFDGGQRLLTAAGDNTARIWDVRSGKELLKLGNGWLEVDGTGFRGAAAVSKDGRWVATGSNASGASELQTLAKLWNAKTGQLVRQIDVHKTEEEPFDATAITFSPDGRLLFVGDQFGNCRLFDTATGLLRITFEHGGKINGAEFLGTESRFLLTASSDGTVVKWSIQDDEARRLLTLPHGSYRIVTMDLSADQRYVATGVVGKDTRSGLRLWDITGGDPTEPVRAFSLEDREIVRSVDFHPDGDSLLVTAYRRGERTNPYYIARWAWNGDGCVKIQDELKDVSMAIHSPVEKEILLLGGKGARREQERPDGRFELKMSYRSQRDTSCVSFSANGQLLVSVGADSFVKMWRLDSETRSWLPAEKFIHKHNGAVNSAVFHPFDDRVLITGGEDGTVKLWKKDGNQWNREGEGTHQGSVHQVVFSADGSRVLTVSQDGTAKVWSYKADADRLTLQQTLQHERGEDKQLVPVLCGGFFPRGDRIVTGTDREFWIWDSHGLRGEPEDATHSASITSVAFSKDGRRMLSGSKDSTMKIWDTQRLLDDDDIQLLLTLEKHTGEVTSVAFSPNGLNVVTAGLDGMTIIWPSDPIEPSIGLPEREIEYTIGSERKQIAANATVNEPTPTDFTSAELIVELKCEHSFASGQAGHLDFGESASLGESADVEESVIWIRHKPDSMATGVQRFVFTPRPGAKADHNSVQELLRDITYDLDMRPGRAGALQAGESAECTVVLELNGMLYEDSKGEAKRFGKISESILIRIEPSSAGLDSESENEQAKESADKLDERLACIGTDIDTLREKRKQEEQTPRERDIAEIRSKLARVKTDIEDLHGEKKSDGHVD